MKIVADTNVLVRAITDDHPIQSKTARGELERADIVAIGTSSLCELVWVLSSIYKISRVGIAEAIRCLTSGANVRVDRITVDAGLASLDAGGDFADGAIAFEGYRLGGETFVSFDKGAVRMLKAAGTNVRQL